MFCLVLLHIISKKKKELVILNLTKELILAEGGERICYLDPSDGSKIIKIEKVSETSNQQNELEYKYYKHLEKKGIDFTHIAKCYGWIETNQGKGLSFERIVDYNGGNSKHFREYLRNNLLTQETEEKLLFELENYLITNEVVFIDVSTVNLFCQQTTPNSYRLVIFDGLGGRRYGFKFLLYMFSKKFTRYKVKKQWKIFCNNYNRDKQIGKGR